MTVNAYLTNMIAVTVQISTAADMSGSVSLEGVMPSMDDVKQTMDTGVTKIEGVPKLAAGSFNTVEVPMRIMYTDSDDTSSPWEDMQGWFVARTPVYVAWQPKGNTTGKREIATGKGYIKEFPYPGFDMEDAKFKEVEVLFEFETPTIGAVPAP